jgi:tRNA(Ile)-lysidine synthase
MHKFTRNFLTEWRKLKLPFENETFIIAVSGGADSVSLLLVLCELRKLKKLKLNFIAAHFNHDLRGAESEADAEFVRVLAEKLEIEFILGAIKHPKLKLQNQKNNLEQAARLARYDFLFQTAEHYGAFGVLTAHTLNDQAETFLLNLIRGSGVAGLSAMTPVRPLNKNTEIRLIRPLLNWAKREDTENFALETGFRADSMNEDEKFSRVRIRKTLLPLLAEFNPKIVETLAQTAQLLRETAVDSLVGDEQLPENPAIKELKTLSKSTLYSVLRGWLETRRGDLRQIDLKHIAAIERLILSPKSGRIVELPGGESIVKRSGRLFFEKTKVEKSRRAN